MLQSQSHKVDFEMMEMLYSQAIKFLLTLANYMLPRAVALLQCCLLINRFSVANTQNQGEAAH